MKLTDNQERLLDELLNKYERSKTFRGNNRVHQTFALSPEDIWSDYRSDYADVDKVRDFELELQELERYGLIILERKQGEITRIMAVEDGPERFYELLNRKSQYAIVEEQIAFFTGWEQKGIPVISDYCREQIGKLQAGKKAQYSAEVAGQIFRVVEYLETPHEDLLERELSILLFSDSKVFETTYRTRVCRLLEQYGQPGDFMYEAEDTREREKILLEEFGVFANPSYVYMKGKGRLRFYHRKEIELGEAPFAFSSEMLKDLSEVQIDSPRIVTIENLTSFHRIWDEDSTFLFLSGYHNSAKQEFLKKAAEENQKKQWFHFGDLDPDGFCILKHLREGTGIDFAPLHMNVEELQTHHSFCKKMTENDRAKAENLIREGYFQDVLHYMLEHNCKLEQEIISMQGIKGYKSFK